MARKRLSDDGGTAEILRVCLPPDEAREARRLAREEDLSVSALLRKRARLAPTPIKNGKIPLRGRRPRS